MAHPNPSEPAPEPRILAQKARNLVVDLLGHDDDDAEAQVTDLLCMTWNQGYCASIRNELSRAAKRAKRLGGKPLTVRLTSTPR